VESLTGMAHQRIGYRIHLSPSIWNRRCLKASEVSWSDRNVVTGAPGPRDWSVWLFGFHCRPLPSAIAHSAAPTWRQLSQFIARETEFSLVEPTRKLKPYKTKLRQAKQLERRRESAFTLRQGSQNRRA